MTRFALTVLLFLFLSATSFCQLKLVGKITDQHNNPIELATIKLDGLGRIAMSNDSGYFHMNLPGGMKKGDALVIDASKDGYKDVVKHVKISDSLVLIVLYDNSPTQEIKPIVHTPKPDPGYFQNKAFAVQHQSDTVAPRTLTKENLEDIFFSISSDKSKSIKIECVKDDLEALHFANAIHETLMLSGYTNVSDVAIVAFPQPIKGQFINRDASGSKITIGHKP